MSTSTSTIPPRRSLVLFALLAMLMVVFSYLFTLLLAFVCVYVPWWLLSHTLTMPALLLFLGGVVIAGIMLWSLIPRRDKFKAPGIKLESVRHPRLFAEIEKIATSLNEPLPGEIYLIAEPDAWVGDRGGFMGFGSRRMMGLGLPLLASLNVSQFRAILTHEFAHYYGGDTNLGPWVRRAQMGMIRSFHGIASVGKHRLPGVVALLYMIVFSVLEWYWHLFLDAVNFVSRRQEFRADELACILAGPEWLKSGLRAVHGTATAWPTYWQTQVLPMINLGGLPSIAAGFSHFLSVPDVAKQVQSGIEKEISEGKENAYDTHPPLQARLDAAERVKVQSPAGDLSPALVLLNDADSEELRLLQNANPNLSKKSLKRVSWEEGGNQVLIQSWMVWVAECSSLLQDIKAENLLDALGRVPQIAPKIRDPKGTLLRPDQRIERARSLLATALGLLLVRKGWQLHSCPGEYYLSRGDEKVNPNRLLQELSDGSISKEAWATKAKEMGIDGLTLNIRASSPSPGPVLQRATSG